MSIPNWIVPLQMHVETGNSLAGKSSGSGFLASAAFPARRASGIFASVPPLQRRLRAGFAPGFLLSSRSEKRETCAVFHYTDGAESCQERFFLGGPGQALARRRRSVPVMRFFRSCGGSRTGKKNGGAGYRYRVDCISRETSDTLPLLCHQLCGRLTLVKHVRRLNAMIERRYSAVKKLLLPEARVPSKQLNSTVFSRAIFVGISK